MLIRNRFVKLFGILVILVFCIGGNPAVSNAQGSSTLCVRLQVPFVWIRVAPSSSAEVLETDYPTDCVPRPMTWVNHVTSYDGVQTWLQVTAFLHQPQTGWVEFNSVFEPGAATQPPPSVALPTPPQIASGGYRVLTSVPYVWLRTSPSSSAPVLNTVNRHDCQTIPPIDVFNEAPYWDGAQWWVHVGIPPRDTSVNGWVELRSLTRCY